jgi:RluA family pseudouridine synthase
VIESIKLSSPATREFWEITVLFEDGALLALDKPAGLLLQPDRSDPQRPSLMKLLHTGIAEKKPWAQQRLLSYLMPAHRLDFETGGVLLFAKNKSTLVALANLFGSNCPLLTCHALVHGRPTGAAFEVDVPLAPHPAQAGLVRVDRTRGKRSQTRCELLETFSGYSLLQCRPLTGRAHQIRVHLQHHGLPVVGDSVYGGKPLLLSTLKPGFYLKPQRTERPLLARAALHAAQLAFEHPQTGAPVTIEAPQPKDLRVALKYLRRYAGV